MDLAKRIAANTAWQIAGKAIAVALGVIVTILLTRYLGPAGYGQYTYILVFVTMFGVIGDWGLNLITVREASQNRARAGEIIGSIVGLRLTLSVLAMILAAGASLVLSSPPAVQAGIFVFSFFLLAASLKTSFQIIFNVCLRMEFWALSEVAANILYLALVIILVFLRASLPAVLAAAVAGQVLSALIAVALGCRLIPVKLSLWRHETERILFEALPMGGILVLFTIYNRADTLILSHFHSPAAVGFYGAAYKIYEVLITPAAYFANSVLPVISGYAVSNRQKLLTTYRKCFLALLFFGGLAALGNYLLAPVGILLIAGRDFLPAVAPLQILSLSLIVSYLNHLNGYTIVALGKQRLSLVIATIALATNIILNILLIPAYSYLAAAFITFLTEGLIALLSLFVVHRGLCATTSHAPRATSQKP